MNPLPTINTQPADVTICENGDAVVSIDASCVGGVTYLWYVDNGGGAVAIIDDATYSGATTDSLNITAAGIGMAGYTYQCIVTSVTGGCDVTSSSATLAINPLATISLQPVDVQACETGNTSFTVTASATGGVTYQWQEDDGSGFVDLANGAFYSGVAKDTLSLTGVDMTLDNYLYRCVVTTTTGSCGLNSASAELIVNPLAVVSVQPADTSACENSDATISVTASATIGWVTYQWQEDNGGGFVNIINGGIYGGATTASLSLTGITAGMDT